MGEDLARLLGKVQLVHRAQRVRHHPSTTKPLVPDWVRGTRNGDLKPWEVGGATVSLRGC